jgi:hypothetical protein
MKYAKNSTSSKMVAFRRHSINVNGDKNESVSQFVM